MGIIQFQKILLFEGKTDNTNLANEILEHKISNMMVRDDFKILYSKDVNGTVDLLSSMYSSIKNILNKHLSNKTDLELLDIFKNHNELMPYQQFIETFKKIKNNNIGSIMSKMINCINKMSSAKSELLSNH